MRTPALSDNEDEDLMPRSEHRAVKKALLNMIERAKGVIMEGRTCAKDQCADCPVGINGIDVCIKRFSINK